MYVCMYVMFAIQNWKSLRESVISCILSYSKTLVYFDFSNAPHLN